MKKQQNTSILYALLDENNTEPLTLFDEYGDEHKFEQVAVIPDNYRLYCILHPITHIEGVEDDEAIVFECTEEGNLVVVEEEKQAMKIYDRYLQMLEDAKKKK